MTIPEVREVDRAQWLPTARELAQAGAIYLDFIAATDLGNDQVEVVAHVMKPDATSRVLLRTVISFDQELASLVAVYPGAAWHEREATEMVGARFTDAAARQSFFLSATDAQPPLRRSTQLTARTREAWPGAYEPDGASRARPKPTPGIPNEWTRHE